MKNEDFFDSLFYKDEICKNLISAPAALEWIKYVDDSLVACHYKKGQLLLTGGQTPDQIFFIKTGAVRAYKNDSDGKNHTFYLWDQGALVTDIVSFLNQQPSDLYIEVWEDVSCISISRSVLTKVLSAHPESIVFFYSILLKYTVHHMERDMDHLMLNAGDRLDKLIRSRKNVLNTFHRDHIASFLGISRSWLFELNRKKIRKNFKKASHTDRN